MKILFSLHLMPPKRLSGSELYIYRLIKYLQSQGQECRVLLHPYIEPGKTEFDYPQDKMLSYDSIQIFPFLLKGVTENCILWADRIITQLHPTAWTLGIGNIYGKKVIHIVHAEDTFESIAKYPHAGVVYNSKFLADLKAYPNPSFILHPIIPDLPISEGECITMINLNPNKGVNIFYEIAAALPNERFIGVKGTYGEQVYSDLPNVQIIEPTEDIASVLAETKILVCPSEKESYSMVAAEAISAGIPVICTELPGFRENLGNAGIYCKRNAADFVQAIESLSKKRDYIRTRGAALLRADEQAKQISADLQKFIQWLYDLT